MKTAGPLEGYYMYDPTWPLETHQVADELMAQGTIITAPLIWRWSWPWETAERGLYFRQRCALDDATLVEWTHRSREVAKLPLTGYYRFLVDTVGRQLDVALNVRARKWRQRSKSDWRQADLLDEVTAAAGLGVLRGREVWFCCPFHEERTPSLHVNPEARIWKCFGCDRGGGVVEWRREAQKSGKTPSRFA